MASETVNANDNQMGKVSVSNGGENPSRARERETFTEEERKGAGPARERRSGKRRRRRRASEEFFPKPTGSFFVSLVSGNEREALCNAWDAIEWSRLFGRKVSIFSPL